MGKARAVYLFVTTESSNEMFPVSVENHSLMTHLFLNTITLHIVLYI